MDQKLRLRILKKLAQTAPTQTAAPSTTAPPLGAPPAIPGELSASLNNGYNGTTVELIKQLTKILHDTLHYASGGKGNFAKIKSNNYTPEGDDKEIGQVSKDFYSTFLNNGNAHNGGKHYEGQQIGIWADTILGSTAFNNIPTINPSNPLANKMTSAAGGSNLKDAVRDRLKKIKDANPPK